MKEQTKTVIQLLETSVEKLIMSVKKPTNKGVVLNCRSYAPIKHKKFAEKAVHRFLKSTTTWKDFDKTLKENESMRLKNEWYEGRTSVIIIDASQKFMTKPNFKSGDKKYNKGELNQTRKNLHLCFCCSTEVTSACNCRKSWKKCSNWQPFRTRQNYKHAYLKYSFDSNLIFQVVYQLSCFDCNST